MKDFSSKKISLVLGSGGARGLTHIGVIKILEEKGAVIDEVVGCSIGSLIGGLYAYGKLNIFEEWVLNLKKADILGYMDFAFPKSGLLKGVKIIDKLKEIIPDTKIESLPVMFSAVVTELTKEKDLVVRSGSFYEAIRASIGIPGVFTTINIRNKIFVDGGVLNPLPLNHVTKRAENIVVAVNLDALPETENIVHKNGALEKLSTASILINAYNASQHQLGRLALEFYKPDYVINVPNNIVGSWEYDKAEFLIEKGKEFANEILNGRVYTDYFSFE